MSIPQPRPWPVIGNVPAIDPSAPVQSMMRLAREYGPLFRLEFPNRAVLIASSQVIVNELCDEQRFEKHISGPLKNVRAFAGDGLFTAYNEEPNWERAHRILMPAFGPAAMRGYFDAMLDISEQLVTKWERLGPDEDLDVADNMTRLTLDTIALCGFAYRFNSFYAEQMHPFVDAMVRSLAEAGLRTRQLPLQTRLRLIANASYERDISLMNEIVDRVIRERRAKGDDGSPKRDLLGLMLEGKDPKSGESLDDVNIRYQIVTFLIAGHETTSGLLSFTIYHLLRHPEVLARAREEVDRVLGADPRHLPTFEEIRQLEYVDRVLKESLRVWPTAPAFAVHPKEPETVAGHALSPGDEIFVLTPMLHRDPAVWGPDPERFDPERFTPEQVAKRPVHAWKPFGNGMRACIGREFAMLEAKLVLAMVLHRFELSDPHGYQLKVKETLTLKPEGLRIHARRRTPANPSQTSFSPSLSRAEPPPTSSPGLDKLGLKAAPHGQKLLILFGSNTGSAEGFARQLGADAEKLGYAVTVDAMDAKVGQLPKDGAMLIVTASYNGKPPDNAAAFCDWVDRLGAGELEGVRYAVFGCGSRDWAATYQAVPKRVDEALAKAGAVRVHERGEADSSADFFGDFEPWHRSVFGAVGEALGLENVAANDDLPGLEIERVPAAEQHLAPVHGLMPMEVLENRELVDLSSPFGRSKRHLEVRLPEGVTYSVGDHLEVLPENPTDRITRAAKRFGLREDELIIVRGGGAPGSVIPRDQPVKVGVLLGRYVELSAPASKRALKALADKTRCPPEKQKLLALAGDEYEQEIVGKRLSLLELLEEFAACELGFAEFLALAPPLRPRRYSISSSPRVSSDRCALTVALVDAPAWSGKGRYQGACSSYLAQLAPGQTILAAVRKPPTAFTPPSDPSVPLVLIAAGTGLAPFRGFLQDRAALVEAGETLGPAHLFFGCDHPEVDYLYRAELEALAARGLVTLHAAFFRAPDGEVTFVQHRLWADRATLPPLSQTHFFVCGDGKRMAPAVKETVARIAAEQLGDPGRGQEFLAAAEREGRYKIDVFGG